MGGVRRGRSSPAAAKGANSCGAGPQGLTCSSAPRPKGTYELSVEAEERKYKAAVKKSKRTHSSETAKRWFLTIARTPGACARCGDKLAGGAEVVYRHEPRETRCVRCASRLEASKGYRPSIRWERKQRVAQ